MNIKKLIKKLGRTIMMEYYVTRVLWRGMELPDSKLENHLQMAIDNAELGLLDAEMHNRRKEAANYKFILESLTKAKDRI